MEGHHESGYLFCEGIPTGTSRSQLDACGHADKQYPPPSSATSFVVVLLLTSAVYVGGGLAVGKRAGRGGGVHAHQVSSTLPFPTKEMRCR